MGKETVSSGTQRTGAAVRLSARIIIVSCALVVACIKNRKKASTKLDIEIRRNRGDLTISEGNDPGHAEKFIEQKYGSLRERHRGKN